MSRFSLYKTPLQKNHHVTKLLYNGILYTHNTSMSEKDIDYYNLVEEYILNKNNLLRDFEFRYNINRPLYQYHHIGMIPIDLKPIIRKIKLNIYLKKTR